MRVLVTGASRGLGLSLCRLLSEQGEDVLAVCRQAGSELNELPGVTAVEGVELAEPGATAQIGSALGVAEIDLVICNAGINRSFAGLIADVDVETLEREFQVNALGAVRTVQATRGHLHDGSKIVLISSGVVNPQGPGRRTPAMYGYKMSKAALNEFGLALANELADVGVVVLVFDPGPMDTSLLREVFDAGHTSFDPRRDGQDPDAVARAMLEQIDAATIEATGRWFSAAGAELVL